MDDRLGADPLIPPLPLSLGFGGGGGPDLDPDGFGVLGATTVGGGFGGGGTLALVAGSWTIGAADGFTGALLLPMLDVVLAVAETGAALGGGGRGLGGGGREDGDDGDGVLALASGGRGGGGGGGGVAKEGDPLSSVFAFFEGDASGESSW